VTKYSGKLSVVVLCLADRGGLDGLLFPYSEKRHCDHCREGKRDYEGIDRRGRENLEIEVGGSTGSRMV